MSRVIFVFSKTGSVIDRPAPGTYRHDDLETSRGNVISMYEGEGEILPLIDDMLPSTLYEFNESGKPFITITDLIGWTQIARNGWRVTTGQSISVVGTTSMTAGSYFFPMKKMLPHGESSDMIILDATVANGTITMQGAIPTSGKWICDAELMREEGQTHTDYEFAGITIIAVNSTGSSR